MQATAEALSSIESPLAPTNVDQVIDRQRYLYETGYAIADRPPIIEWIPNWDVWMRFINHPNYGPRTSGAVVMGPNGKSYNLHSGEAQWLDEEETEEVMGPMLEMIDRNVRRFADLPDSLDLVFEFEFLAGLYRWGNSSAHLDKGLDASRNMRGLLVHSAAIGPTTDQFPGTHRVFGPDRDTVPVNSAVPSYNAPQAGITRGHGTSVHRPPDTRGKKLARAFARVDYYL